MSLSASVALSSLLVLAAGGEPRPTPGAQSACQRSEAVAEIKKVTLDKGRWSEPNHARLSAMIQRYGATSPGYDPCARPLAVFDFDNTSIAGDIGDEAFYRAASDPIFAPSEAFFALFPEGERAAIKPLFEGEHAATISERTSRIIQSYDALCSEKGNAVCYPWVTQLFVGLEPLALERFAAEVIDRALLEGPRVVEIPRPEGAKGAGSIRHSRGVALRPEIVNLMAVLSRHGFDVFIVTASPEWLVRVFAPRLGVSPDHVLGIRTQTGKDGRVGSEILPPVTYRSGKVEAIRTRIAPGGRRPIFVAGDAPTDWEMLDEAQGEALLFDRSHPELLAHAKTRGFLIQTPFEK